jgi:hypothetical protein
MEINQTMENLGPYLTPAIIVAMVALIVQSIFSTLVSIHNFSSRKQSKKNYEIQHLTSLLSLVDSLPLDQSQKASKKIKLIKKYAYYEIPTEILEDFK